MSAPDAPRRLRRLIRPALWRAAARGLAAVLLATAFAVPLASFGWTMPAIFVAIVLGLNLGLWAGRDSMLASLAGAVLIPVVGLVIAHYSDVQLMGPSAGVIALDDIGRFPYAAQFHFTDARVATEFSTSSRPRRPDNAAQRGAWRIAPIVAGNWTPTQPVQAWAVAKVSGYGPFDFRTPRSWQQSYRGGVRYVATAFSPAHTALARALERFDLTAAPRAPLLYWVEEPQTVIADERTFLAWVMFGGIATWLVFLIGETLLVPAPAPPDARRDPPRPSERPSGAAALPQSVEGGSA
ncbi:MAG TPA: hypothetical protein VGG01_21185 [Xanthobacteraceae bacterium]|jgi:hypothetical protein